LKCIADLDINSLPKIKDADIRIFCDNDKIDLDSDGRDVANGGRWKKRGDADNGWLWGWQDKTNILQSVRGQDDPFMPPQGSNFMPDTALNLDEKDRPGCQNEGINGYKNSLAATFTIPLEDKTRQPKESSAITVGCSKGASNYMLTKKQICDKLLKGEKGNINKLPLFKDVKTKELSSLQEGIDTFRSTLSHVMLHELTHTNHCGDSK
jgi:hypothetical protein